MMHNLQFIQKKIDDIGFGLLRVRESDFQTSIQIKAKCNKDNSINCHAADKSDLQQLKNRTVSLVQKHNDDFLYIVGQTELPDSSKTLSVRIYKACWLIRKTNGSLTWLQEKYIYDLASA